MPYPRHRSNSTMAEDEEEAKVKLEVEVPASDISVKNPKNSSKEKPEEDKDPTTIAGYKPEDILAAPMEKPEPQDKRPPNIHQKRVMLLGFTVVGISIFVWAAFGFIVGVGVAMAGALVVAASVLIRF